MDKTDRVDSLFYSVRGYTDRTDIRSTNQKLDRLDRYSFIQSEIGQIGQILVYLRQRTHI